MDVLVNERLEELVTNALETITQARLIMPQLDKYVQSPNNSRVCCLYGLRRTGKTTMMYQEINKLGVENCLFILCEAKDDICLLKKKLEEYGKYKYIFIDEVTALEDFIDCSAFLADIYAASGKKIILTGTDSLGFRLAGNGSLFTRMDFIHTTFIPYKEYNMLLNKDIEEYIKYGGTLAPEIVFKDRMNAEQYTNTAIVDNILHGIENWEVGRNPEYARFSALKDNDWNTGIRKVIEFHNRTFVSNIINRKFKSHDFGLLRHNLTNMANRAEKEGETDGIITDTTPLQNEQLIDQIQAALLINDIPEPFATDEGIKVVTEYLEKLDVLYHIPKDDDDLIDEYIFTQPGMRYYQLSAMLELIDTSKYLKSYNDADRGLIKRLLSHEIMGRMLEDIVFYQTAHDYESNDKVKVKKYRHNNKEEIDVIVRTEDIGFVALEVKFADAPIYELDGDHLKNLANDEFCRVVSEEVIGLPIVGKAVIYRGETDYENEIPFVNVEEYLSDIPGTLELIKRNTEYGTSVKPPRKSQKNIVERDDN